MSNALVFVFLLDNLSDYNKTLIESFNSTIQPQTNTSDIQQCDTVITDEILFAISKQLHLTIKPTWRRGKLFTDTYQRNAPDTLHQGVGFDNSIASDNSKEGSFDRDINTNFISEDYTRRYDDSDCAEEVITKEKVIKNETKVQFPKSAPFLVAIFETLSNITAQTCAGTVVAPQWVLTAASCINLLADVYANDTSGSHYTIVAGSTNPLSGGTAHNVTRILLHPDAPDVTDAVQGSAGKGPFLALMRIEPGIEGDTVKVAGGNVESKEVMVYGWTLIKNEVQPDNMNFTTVTAEVVPRAECHTVFEYTNDDILCLSNRDPAKNAVLLSTGGPVLVIQNNETKMLAVAQTDDHLFVAYSLAAHLKWIKKVIQDK